MQQRLYTVVYGCRRAAPHRRPAWRSTRATRHCTHRATAGRRSTAQVLGRRARRRCRQARAWWGTAKGVICACRGAPATRPSVRRSCGRRATRAASFAPTTRRRAAYQLMTTYHVPRTPLVLTHQLLTSRRRQSAARGRARGLTGLEFLGSRSAAAVTCCSLSTTAIQRP